MKDFPIHGHVDSRFEAVRDAFAANFAKGLETGASFAVELEGRMVVDLWGGYADRDCTQPWKRDTLATVWSTTKGLASLCVAILVDRGRIRYDQKLSTLWPEFAAAGKEDLTIDEVLSHQGGLSGLVERIDARAYADHEFMAARLAAQAPLFPVGQCGYHAMTHGFLTGEIVRRATGRTLGRFFAEVLAAPLELDAWIGLPEREDDRVARMVPAPRPPAPPKPAADAPPREPIHPAMRAALGNPPLTGEEPNERWWRAAEIPAANACANARAVATLYGMLARGGESAGHRFLSADTIREATRTRIHAKDLVLDMPARWAAGFSRNDGITYGPNRATFGHSGWGGSFGCADPDRAMSMSYVMNRQHANLRGDPRTLALVEAVYGSL